MSMARTLITLSIAGTMFMACSSQDTNLSSTKAAEPSNASSMQETKSAPKISLLASRKADATTLIINRQGNTVGSALLYQGSSGVVVRLSVGNLAPGIHGMHFHAKGTCEDPSAGFKATGGHVMPFGKPHGYINPEGPHAGNLPNLIIGEDGTASVELYTGLVTLFEGPAALLDGDGSTLIIHENEDDHFTQPIGGAGGRVACGVIKRPE